MCCHVGGDIDFDAAGNLYLSTGDDTNPFDSAGFTPIDERAERNPAFDAQRTSANSNDLRGKVLRIKPSAAGGYTIPAGNMFAPGTARTRPEVYAMGFRNPFRMSVDKATGIVYLGDYGPDAGTADPNRGPAGNVAFERITRPGFYGWPYCSALQRRPTTTTPSRPGRPAPKFNCAGGPVNNSPQQHRHHPAAAGRRGLAAVRRLRPGRRSSPAAACRRWAARSTTTTRRSPRDVEFPAYYDGKVFARRVRSPLDQERSRSTPPAGRLTIEPVPVDRHRRSWTWSSGRTARCTCSTTAPAGSAATPTRRSTASSTTRRAAEHRSPRRRATPTSGTAPLTVQFSSAGTNDPDGDPITYAWDFTNNGSTDSTAANPSVHVPDQRECTRR